MSASYGDDCTEGEARCFAKRSCDCDRKGSCKLETLKQSATAQQVKKRFWVQSTLANMVRTSYLTSQQECCVFDTFFSIVRYQILSIDFYLLLTCAMEVGRLFWYNFRILNIFSRIHWILDSFIGFLMSIFDGEMDVYAIYLFSSLFILCALCMFWKGMNKM